MTSVALFSQLTGESDGEVHRPLHATRASGEVVELRRVDRELLADVVDQVSDRLEVQRVDGDGRVLPAATRLVLREEAEALEPVHQANLIRALDLRERDEELRSEEH